MISLNQMILSKMRLIKKLIKKILMMR